MRAFGGRGKTKNRNKSRFSTLANLLIFLLTEYIQLFLVLKWSDFVEFNRREGGSNFTFVCEKGCPSTALSNWGSIFFKKGPYLWRYGTPIHKTGHSVVANCSSVRKRRIVAKKKCRSVWAGQTTVIGRRSVFKNSSKNSGKVLLVSGYF